MPFAAWYGRGLDSDCFAKPQNKFSKFTEKGSRIMVVPLVRALRETDRSDWARLYENYAAFYKVEQTAEMRETVWSWMLDPLKEVEALVAENSDGKLIGIAHYRPFSRPLAASVGGFLDDLFVDPDVRGQGVADALIGALKTEAEIRGWTVIRWITAEDNYRARGVYDRLAARTKWITYDIKL